MWKPTITQCTPRVGVREKGWKFWARREFLNRARWHFFFIWNWNRTAFKENFERGITGMLRKHLSYNKAQIEMLWQFRGNRELGNPSLDFFTGNISTPFKVGLKVFYCKKFVRSVYNIPRMLCQRGVLVSHPLVPLSHPLSKISTKIKVTRLTDLRIKCEPQKQSIMSPFSKITITETLFFSYLKV